MADVCNALIDLLESTGLTNKQFLEAAQGLSLAEEKKLSRHLLGQVSSGPSTHFVHAIITFAARHHGVSAAVLGGKHPALGKFVEPTPTGHQASDRTLLEPAAPFHGTNEQRRQAGWLLEMILAGDEPMAAVALAAIDVQAPDATIGTLRVIARCDPGAVVVLLDLTRDLYGEVRSEKFIRRLADLDPPAAHAVKHWPRPNAFRWRRLSTPWDDNRLTAALDRTSPSWARLRRLAAYVEHGESSWQAAQARNEVIDLVDKGYLQLALSVLLGIADSSRSVASGISNVSRSGLPPAKVTKAFQDFMDSLAVQDPQGLHTLLSELAATQGSRFREFLTAMPPRAVGGFLRTHCAEPTRLKTVGGYSLLRQVLMYCEELPLALLAYLELTTTAPREYASDILFEQLPDLKHTLDLMVDHDADAAAVFVVNALVSARERPNNHVPTLAQRVARNDLWTFDDDPSKLMTALFAARPTEAVALMILEPNVHWRSRKAMRLLELNSLLVIRWTNALPLQEVVHLITVLARDVLENTVKAGTSIWGPTVEHAPDIARSLLLHAANNLPDDGLLLIEVAAKYHRSSDWEAITRAANISDAEGLSALLAQVPLNPAREVSG